MLMLGFGIILVTKIGAEEFLRTMQLPGDLPKLIFQVHAEEKYSCNYLLKMMRMQELMANAVMCA